jgi:predicted subunit of tRNA(5-methylaminomethyl-2-thiouridylate) methyltransferase
MAPSMPATYMMASLYGLTTFAMARKAAAVCHFQHKALTTTTRIRMKQAAAASGDCNPQRASD